MGGGELWELLRREDQCPRGVEEGKVGGSRASLEVLCWLQLLVGMVLLVWVEWEACRGEVWAVEGVMVVVAGLVMVALLLVVCRGDEASEVSASSCRRS